MSAPEFTEQRSSVKITMNAKGEAQVEVKVYDPADVLATTALPGKLDFLREEAVRTYVATVAAVRP